MHLLHVVSTSADRPNCEPGCDGAAIFLPDGARLTETAENAILDAFANHTEAVGAYGDIDIEGVVTRRPAWSPTRAVTEPSAASPLAVRCSTLAELGCDISDLTLPLRLAENRAVVLHVPAVLSVHSVAPRGASKTQLNAHLQKIGIAATVESSSHKGQNRLVVDREYCPAVSIIIPTAGIPLSREPGAAISVERCLASIAACRRGNLEVILVVGDEYEGDPADLDHAGLSVSVARRPPGDFDFAAACNLGILKARNELILLLNDDTEADADAVDALAVHFGDSTVGAVGAMLRYPDGTVQHAGLVIDHGLPLHPFKGWHPQETARFGGTVARDVVAVTGACLMTRRSLVLELGGFSALFPLSYNDIDLCLKIRRSGWRVVVEPHATLLHYETLSREPKTYDWEWHRWLDRWGDVTDPWYHPAYRRPNNPKNMHLNADHLEPAEPDRRATPQRVRDHRVSSRVHHQQPVSASLQQGIEVSAARQSDVDPWSSDPVGRADPLNADTHDRTSEILGLRDIAFGQRVRMQVLTSEIAKLERHNADLISNLKELENNTQEAIDRLAVEHHTLHEQYHALHEQNHALNERNEALHEQNEALHVELARSPIVRVARAVRRRVGRGTQRADPEDAANSPPSRPR